MKTFLTLIARPGGLSAEAVARAEGSVRAAGATAIAGRWLSPGEAYDIELDRPLSAETRAAAAAAAGDEIDLVHQQTDDRRRRLLIADMDSTIITAECIDEIADLVGLKPEVAAITERAMRGEIEFEPALRERVALLKGLSEDDLARVYRERVRLMPGATALTQTMRAHGAVTALVSGGFTFFTSRVGAFAGFDETQGNVLDVEGGRLTGRVVEPILGRDAKRDALVRIAAQRSIPLSAALAVGDGANDLAMIAAAGFGVAFRAKPKVQAAAPAAITYGDLTALLFLQGYARSEFVDTAA